jgi:hypothetical protein
VRLSSERRAEFAELAAEARALVLPQPHTRRAAIISATRRRAQSRSAVSISSMHAVFDQRCVAVAEIDDCSLPVLKRCSRLSIDSSISHLPKACARRKIHVERE